MSSILKVDTLQDSGGNSIITSNGSGTFTSSLPDTGITMADQWRLTADTNEDTSADITTNWERNDTPGYSSIGTGLTESSGIFSFPQTGIYLIIPTISWTIANGDGTVRVNLNITTDNSTYSVASEILNGNKGSAAINSITTSQFIFDVTNISTHKFKFTTNSFNIGTGTSVRGNTSQNETCFSVIKLGDT